MIDKFGLEQLVRIPTRCTKHSSSIIDHIYASNKEKIDTISVSSLAISDHFPICFTYSSSSKIKKNGHKSMKYRSFKKFDEEAYRIDLLFSGLEMAEICSEPNEALDIFYNCINFTLNKHAPIKEKRIKREHQPNWYTDEIKNAARERDYHKRKGNHDQYKILKNKTSFLIKKSRREFFNEAIKENKESKLIWKSLKER